MKLGVLFSGGKDSCLALYKAKRFHEVVCLISLISENPESYMFHVPNIELTKIQAEAIGLPLIQEITGGEKEKELADLKKTLMLAEKRFKIKGVVTGAMKSIYQASRVQRICLALGLWCFNPLWLKDSMELLNELIENDFKAVISGVFAYPLNRAFLGKTIDKDIVKKLEEFKEKYALDPSGEGGEIETTVIDAPIFKKRIEIVDYEILFHNNSGVFKIKNLRLADK